MFVVFCGITCLFNGDVAKEKAEKPVEKPQEVSFPTHALPSCALSGAEWYARSDLDTDCAASETGPATQVVCSALPELPRAVRVHLVAVLQLHEVSAGHRGGLAGPGPGEPHALSLPHPVVHVPCVLLRVLRHHLRGQDRHGAIAVQLRPGSPGADARHAHLRGEGLPPLLDGGRAAEGCQADGQVRPGARAAPRRDHRGHGGERRDQGPRAGEEAGRPHARRQGSPCDLRAPHRHGGRLQQAPRRSLRLRTNLRSQL
eukprot:scaffold8305_cov229-Pinguiococcus_pyrenoidosus.AAC.1